MKYVCTLVLCLSSLLSFGTAKPEVKKAYQANVSIHQETISDEATCSATAIGPQALLTATHCELATDDLEVSGFKAPVKIVGRFRDGLDHTIYLIDGDQFKDFVTVEPNKLDVTDPVFIWGNPGDLTDMYRTGVFSGTKREISLFGVGPMNLYFDLNTYHGDSGAGIFREDGVLVEVVSYTYVQGKNNDIHRMTGAYPLNFKDEELKKAVAFVTEKPKDTNNGTTDSGATPK